MAIQDRLVPLHDALFSETSPGPVKYAASLLGSHGALPPAAGAAGGGDAHVREAMVGAGLLN